MTEISKRPRPFVLTTAGLLLGWLAFVGLLSSVAFPLIVGQQPAEEMPPELRQLLPNLVPFSIAAFVYGLTALIAAVGTWRVRPWAAKAFLAWCVAVGPLLLALPSQTESLFERAVLALFCVCVLSTGYFYIRRAITLGKSDAP